MIKVLHFVSTPAIWSGVMSVIMNYYRHMDRSRIQFDFLCFIPCKNQQESYEREIEELGGRVFFVSKPGISLGSIQELFKFFMAHDGEYQWVHNHEVYLSFLLSPVSKSFGISNFIVHSHTTKFSDHKKSAFRNRILCIPIHWIHCRKFACSMEAGKFLFGEKAVTSGDVYLLHNAIDIAEYTYNQEIRKKLRNELDLSNCLVIGHIGRFVPQKNHNMLIDIFREVTHCLSSVKLLLIGDGPLRKKIHEKVLSYGLDDSVIFLGQCNNISDLLNCMDIFVLPSLYEGLPVSCVEAQANGLTCLVSTAVTKETQYTNNYLTVPDNSSSADWASLILKEAKSHDVLSNACCSKFDINTSAKRLQDFYLYL